MQIGISLHALTPPSHRSAANQHPAQVPAGVAGCAAVSPWQ